MRILIHGGHVLDPAAGTDGVRDLLIENGIIIKSGDLSGTEADRVYEAGGFFVLPGLIDMHVHLREPGFEEKETIRTGTNAAAHGGFTTICVMPNTKPVTDTPERVSFICRKAKEESPVHVLPIGSVTMSQEGTALTDMKGLADAGAIGVSEDGKSVMDAGLYEKGMVCAKEAGLLVMAHCEDKNMAGNGCINAGKKAQEFSLPGISNAVEDVIVARDILLAKETGARLHLCHCSTKDSVAMVRAAKKAGVAVTAECCPHHFALTEDDIREDDGNFKMNPPLRTKEDRKALQEGLADGTIDVISTDHAPHTKVDKEGGFLHAPFGIVGLETALSVTWTTLVEGGILSPLQMVMRMSTTPAGILNREGGTLQEGAPADVTIFDPKASYIIDPETFVSKGKNTPFAGWKVHGKVMATLVDGKVVYDVREDC